MVPGLQRARRGSDLANVRTSARIEHGPNGAQWVINGQKVWTRLRSSPDWIFVIARTESGSHGLSRSVLSPGPDEPASVTVRRPFANDRRRQHSTRSFPGCAHTGAERRGRAGPLVGGSHGHPRIRAGRFDARAIRWRFAGELDSLIAVASENGAGP